MNRRVFVGGVLGGAALPMRGAAQQEGDIPRREFGKTGERLTIVGQASGRFSMVGFEEAKAVTRRAHELGVNYFDTARAYGNGRSEEVYGAVIPAFRKEIFLTTKSARRSRKEAAAELELSLKALKTDYVDLWQIHEVGEMEEVDRIFGPGGAIEAFEAAKKAGKCRFIGFTGHRDPHVHLEMLKRYDRYDSILMPLNPADPSYLSFERLVLPEARQRGMGIQAMKGTANSKLLQSLSVSDCIHYVLSLPIDCLTLGCTTLGQIEDDVRIARGFQPLSDGDMAKLRQRAGKHAGPRLENWKRNTEAARIGRLPEYHGG